MTKTMKVKIVGTIGTVGLVCSLLALSLLKGTSPSSTEKTSFSSGLVVSYDSLGAVQASEDSILRMMINIRDGVATVARLGEIHALIDLQDTLLKKSLSFSYFKTLASDSVASKLAGNWTYMKDRGVSQMAYALSLQSFVEIKPDTSSVGGYSVKTPGDTLQVQVCLKDCSLIRIQYKNGTIDYLSLLASQDGRPLFVGLGRTFLVRW